MQGNRAVLRRGGLVAGVIVLVGISVWVAFPPWRDLVFDENRVAEDLSAGLDLLAFGVGLVAAIRLRGRYQPLSLAVISVTALLFALDEVSWGYNFVDWGPPRWMDVRIDAVHDLLRVAEAYGESAVNGSLPSLVAVVAIAGFVLVAAFGGIRWYRQAALFAQPPATLLVLGLGLAAFAALLDVPDEKAFGPLLGFAVRPVEESIELAAAVVLFQAAWRLRQMSCMAASPDGYSRRSVSESGSGQ